MKELAVSAAALAGLLGFAAFLNSGSSPSYRVKRDITLDESDHVDLMDLETHVSDMFNMSQVAYERLMEQLGGLDMEIDDVQTKGKTLKHRDIPRMHTKMNQLYDNRMQKLKTITKNFGEPTVDCGDAHVENMCGDDSCCPNMHTGSGDTHPVIASILAENGISGSATPADVFAAGRGKSNFYYIAPRSIPISSDSTDGHITDYNNYLAGFKKWAAHFTNGMGVTYGVWHAGVTAAPRNMKYTGSLPWSRMEKFWKNPGQFINQPLLLKTMGNFKNQAMGNIAYNSPTNMDATQNAENCYALWFHHDIPADANALFQGKMNANGLDVLRKCTFAHVFILPSSPGTNSADTKSISNKMGNMLTGSEKIAYDSDFSGNFYLTSFSDIQSDEFINRVSNFFFMAKSRALCRICGDEFMESAVVAASLEATQASDYGVIELDASDYSVDTTSAPDSLYAGDYSVADYTAAEAAEVLDMCCGSHRDSSPFDRRQKYCCAVGRDGTGAVHPDASTC